MSKWKWESGSDVWWLPYYRDNDIFDYIALIRAPNKRDTQVAGEIFPYKDESCHFRLYFESVEQAMREVTKALE
jgi:hypothetical protein